MSYRSNGYDYTYDYSYESPYDNPTSGDSSYPWNQTSYRSHPLERSSTAGSGPLTPHSASSPSYSYEDRTADSSYRYSSQNRRSSRYQDEAFTDFVYGGDYYSQPSSMGSPEGGYPRQVPIQEGSR
jgi:hypothetical protein